MWYNVLVEVRVEISGAPLLFAKTRAALFISTKNAEFAFLMLDFAENSQIFRVNFKFLSKSKLFFRKALTRRNLRAIILSVRRLKI